MNSLEVKVQEAEARQAWVQRCLAVDLCPDCGEKLTHKDWGNGFDIVCKPCDTTHDTVR